MLEVTNTYQVGQNSTQMERNLAFYHNAGRFPVAGEIVGPREHPNVLLNHYNA